MWFYPSNPRVPYFTFFSVNQKNSETSKSHSKFSGRIFEESKRGQRGKKRFVILCCSPQILDKFDYFDSMSCFSDFGVSDWFLQISFSGELFIATRVVYPSQLWFRNRIDLNLPDLLRKETFLDDSWVTWERLIALFSQSFFLGYQKNSWVLLGLWVGRMPSFPNVLLRMML